MTAWPLCSSDSRAQPYDPKNEDKGEMKLYIETTVPNYLFTEQAPGSRRITEVFFGDFEYEAHGEHSPAGKNQPCKFGIWPAFDYNSNTRASDL